MFNKKSPRSFSGAIGAGLPYDDFETALNAPDSVMENLEKMRPMIQALRVTVQTDGWTKYIQPFLEKQKNSSKVLDLVKRGEDARAEAGRVEAFISILNLVNTALRTGTSLDAADAAKEVKDALRD